MKKMMMTLLAFVLAGSISFAQDQTQQKDRIQKRDRIHQEDHLLYQDGKLYQYRNGERTQLQQQLQLKNGTVCNPDGTCQLKDRTQLRLRNGECLDMSGNRYLNQNKFNKNKMMRPNQMNRMQNSNMNRSGQGSGNRTRRGGQ
jgi:hypothetical protein